MSEKDWYRFCVNAEGSVENFFEKDFCRDFFAIQNSVELKDIQNPTNYPGIENIPVNGIAYQSKWTNSWSKHKDSLEKIIKYHKSTYPTLKKVYFYVDEISTSESVERNNPVGLFEELRKVGVEVEFISKDSLFYTVDRDIKYKSLRGYFTIPNDVKGLLEIAERYINELYVEDARIILDIIFSKFDSLDNPQKFTYHKLRGNLKCYDPQNDSKYEEEYFEACSYEGGTARSIILMSVAKIQQGTYDGIEEQLFNLANSGFEPLAQRALIMLYSKQGMHLEEILKRVLPQYKENVHILKILGKTTFHNSDNLNEAFEFFGRGYDLSEEKLFIDTIIYFLIWIDYIQENHGIDSLSIESKKAYEEIWILYETFKDSLPSRSLRKQEKAHIYNFLGISKCRVFNDYDSGICLIKQGLDFFQSPTMLFNLGKMYMDKKEVAKAKEIFSKLYEDFETASPTDRITQQAPILLSEIYASEGNMDLAIKTLEEYSEKYSSLLLPEINKNILLVLVQALDSIGEKEKAIKLIEVEIKNAPNNFIYLIVMHKVTGDTNLLEQAYNIALTMESSYEYPPHDFLQLALRLGEFSFREKSFNLYKKHLKNLEDREHFEKFLGICIQKNDYQMANKIVEQYREIFGIDAFYVYSKAVIDRNQGFYNPAIELIKSYKEYIGDLKLIFELLYIAYEINDIDLIKDSLNNIERHKKFNDLKLELLCEYVKYYHTFVDKIEAIKKLYKYLQMNPESAELKELYFMLLFSEKEIGSLSIEEINVNTIATIKEIGSETCIRISFDGYSKIGIDMITKEGDLTYNKLLGKRKRYVVDDIFKDNPLLSKKYKVIAIENKYVKAYQEVMMGHMIQAGKVESIPVSDGNDFTELRGVLDKMDTSSEARAEEFDKLYQAGLLLFSIMSEFTGKSIYEIYKGVTLGDKWHIISDVLTKFPSKEDLPSKFTIDTTGILTIYQLGLHNILSENCTINVSKSTLDYFTHEINQSQQEINRVSSVLIKQEDGTRVMVDNTEHQKTESLNELLTIKNWIQEKCTIHPNPTFDIEYDSNIKDIVGEEFYDSLILAKNINTMLVSDDLALRKLGRGDDIGIECLSTESLLNVLYNKEIITSIHYCDGLRNLMLLKVANLNFNTGVIFNSLANENSESSTNELKIIYNYCKSFNVDIGFIILSIFETIGNLVRHYEIAQIKFKILMDVICMFYDFDNIKSLYISQLDRTPGSEVKNRFYKLMVDYEKTLRK